MKYSYNVLSHYQSDIYINTYTNTRFCLTYSSSLELLQGGLQGRWHNGFKGVDGLTIIFRTTLRQSQPNKASLECASVPYVRPSKKSFCDFNEIWRVGRGQCVMHEGMQYDPIQEQGHKVKSPSELEIRLFSKAISGN